MGLGFVLVHNNGWPDTARVCRQFIKDEDRYLSLTDCLKSNRTPLGHCVFSIQCRQVTPQMVQEFGDALVQIWEETPSAGSGQLSGMHTNTWEPHKLLSTIFSLCNEILAKYSFHFWFFGCLGIHLSVGSSFPLNNMASFYSYTF